MTRYDVLGNPIYSGQERETRKEKFAAAVSKAIKDNVYDALYFRGESEAAVEKHLIDVEKIEAVEAKKIIASAAKKHTRRNV